MEALRFQIFLWLLNYWRMYRPEHFDMADAWREICESMPPIPVCAREGCDELVLSSQPWIARYCIRECKRTAYEQSPEGKVAKARKGKKYKQTSAGKAVTARADKKYRARKKAERLAAEEQTSP